MLLAIDTSTENCSVALEKAGRIFSVSEVASQKHASLILPMIDKVLAKAKAAKEDLSGIIFGQGPGSFTGVRIGVSTAQGLALGLNLKVVGVSDLKTMALMAAEENDGICVASIDARMGEVYLGIYKKSGTLLEDIIEECVVTPEKAVELINIHAQNYVAIAGTGVAILQNNGLDSDLEVKVLYPEARAMITLAHDSFAQGLGVDPAFALPIYIRNEVTWKKLSEQKSK